jgi:HEAT repeat protein
MQTPKMAPPRHHLSIRCVSWPSGLKSYVRMASLSKVVRSVSIWGFVTSVVCVGQVTAASGSLGQVTASPEARCRDILQQALQDKNPDTRKQAVVALSLAGGQVVSSLRAMLQDGDVQVRLATVASLAEVKSPRAVAALHAALDDEIPEVSFAAAKALVAMHDRAGREAMLAMLEGDAKTSSGVFTKEKREALRMVHTPRTLLLFAVQKGIGFAPVPYLGLGVGSMQQLLSDPEVSGRATAALMLAHERDRATLDALRGALTDKDWSVRAAAVHALALRGDARMKNDLLPLLDDDHQAVRLRAAAAYLRVTGPQAAPSSAHTQGDR